MSRADELIELIRGRIHSEFDGECHLTDTEAHAIADFLSEAEQRARREALEEAQEALRTAQQNNVGNFRISRKPVVKWEPLPAAPAKQEGTL